MTTERTATATGGPRPVIKLLTTAGVVRVRPCGLCAALVVDDGVDRHDEQHRVDRQRSDELADRALQLLDAVTHALRGRP